VSSHAIPSPREPTSRGATASRSSPRPAISIGVIGCGRIARAVHLEVLARHPAARIVALADPDAACLADAARRAPGAAALRDPAALLARDDIDAVVIAVPTAEHAACAVEAFARRRHVYLEKPLAAAVADGHRVVAAWRESGRVGAIGFNYRFDPLLERARRLLLDGAIGELIAIRGVFTTAAIAAADWRRERARGGGAVLDLASHHIDLARHLTGREIVQAAAELRSRHSDDDTAAIQLALGDGVVAQLFSAFGSVEEDRVELFGSQGRVVVDRYRSLHVEADAVGSVRSPLARLRSAALGIAHLPYALEKRRAPGGSPSYARAIDAFLSACRGERVPHPDLADGLACLAVADAALASARSGRTERIDVPPAPAMRPIELAAHP
jgi:predicted dehydrogenase